MKSLIPLLTAINNNQLTLDISSMDNNLIDFSINAGMGTYLKYCSQNSQQPVEQATSQLLLSAELTAKIITTNILNALNEILTHSKQCSSNIILLKGIAHCQSYYPAPWFRIMSDIDLLISKKDTDMLESILIQLKYKQTSKNSHEYYETHHHSMPFYNKKNNTWIEVHTHLFSNTTDVINDDLFNIKKMAMNTMPMKSHQYNDNIKQFSPEFHLIYTCVHWAEDYNLYKTCIQFTDIILLIRQQPFDWLKVSTELNNTASASSVFLALSYLKQSGIIEIPNSFFSSFKLRYKNMGAVNRYILYTIIDNYFLGKKQYSKIANENNLKIIWKTLLKPNTSFNNLILLPCNLLFPPENANRFKISFLFKRFLNLFHKRDA